MRKDQTIKMEIIKLLDSYPTSLAFIKQLSNIGDLLFFGGSIRDYYLYNEFKKMPRDFDIAVKINTPSEYLFEEIINKYQYRKNRFGGYKVIVDKIEFDIWNLKDTWAFKEKKLLAEEKNLSKSVFLSIDGIVYNFNNNILYDEEFKKTIDNNQINIVLKENPQKELNLLRALVFKKRYKLTFAPELKEEYKKSILKDTYLYEKLYALQFNHYKCEYFTQKELQTELNYLNLIELK